MSDIQAETSLVFVRREMTEAEPPPRTVVGPVAWLRRNLFASVSDTILTIIGLTIVALALPPLIRSGLHRRGLERHRPQRLHKSRRPEPVGPS